MRGDTGPLIADRHAAFIASSPPATGALLSSTITGSTPRHHHVSAARKVSGVAMAAASSNNLLFSSGVCTIVLLAKPLIAKLAKPEVRRVLAPAMARLKPTKRSLIASAISERLKPVSIAWRSSVDTARKPRSQSNSRGEIVKLETQPFSVLVLEKLIPDAGGSSTNCIVASRRLKTSPAILLRCHHFFHSVVSRSP